MSRNIIVTGGGTGIGRAIAARFAADEEAVVILGRRHEPLKETAAALGPTVHPVVCDATNPAQVAAALGDLPDEIHVLVNCAGGNTDLQRPEPESLAEVAEAWRANLDANLITAVLMTTALTDRLAAGGTVVNFSSIAADRGAGSYGAAKAAVAAWNVDLARELGPRGVTANVVSPGLTTGTEFFHRRLTPEREQSLIDATFTGRAGTPEDIAETVHFLASPGARHITAQVIALNGGAWPSR